LLLQKSAAVFTGSFLLGDSTQMIDTNTTLSTVATATRRVRFRLAGYLFTYDRASQQARVRIDMWREDPNSGERYWITVATTAPERKSARQVAMALVAWVQWCDVAPRKSAQAQAVAESWAMLQQRISSKNPHATVSVRARSMVQSVPPSNNAASGAE
jgi:hypothetical protein